VGEVEGRMGEGRMVEGRMVEGRMVEINSPREVSA